MVVKHHLISWKHEFHMCDCLNSVHVSMTLRGPIAINIDFAHLGCLGVQFPAASPKKSWCKQIKFPNIIFFQHHFHAHPSRLKKLSLKHRTISSKLSGVQDKHGTLNGAAQWFRVPFASGKMWKFTGHKLKLTWKFFHIMKFIICIFISFPMSSGFIWNFVVHHWWNCEATIVVAVKHVET